MPALIGVLVDVSGSMRQSIGGPVNQEGVSWARSIFRVVDELVKHNVTSDNQVFAIGYGASVKPDVFDLLNTVDQFSGENDYFLLDKRSKLQKILHILEHNGAPHVRRWATMNILDDTVSEEDVDLFLPILENNTYFRSIFIHKFLPDECREITYRTTTATVVKWTPIEWMLSPVKNSTTDSVKEVIVKAHSLASTMQVVVEVGLGSIISVDKASNILRGRITEDKLTNKEIDRLMRTVDPFIYGGTPMISALEKAKYLMDQPGFEKHEKVLFVLSDGEPADGDSPPVFDDVHVVSCYITKCSISDPKRLYSTECGHWDKGAKFMFRLASAIPTQRLPRTIFVRRGWKVDITNNETQLFLQVNHPDLLDEVCAFAREVVCSQNALSDILASIDLDMYINKANEGFGAKDQEESTCYANASAAVMHLATKRIVGREGGSPDFFVLRQQLINTYGKVGANTLKVLQEVCPRYRLHCQITDVHGALKAVAAKRPVIARFRLTDKEWDLFSRFYEDNPRGILTDIGIGNRTHGASLCGHAVVLTSFNSEGLVLMNSWGSNWGNNGFFSVRNDKILGLEFIDVYWTQNDLSKSEIESYERRGHIIAKERLASLKGLNTATFTCPLCRQVSNVSKFTGKLVDATCPICHRVFEINSHDAHDLVLYMYLTSLCRESSGVDQ